MNAPAIIDALPAALCPEKLERLEGAMLELPQAECPVEHIFAPGIYVRQVTLRAGTYAIGHEQTTTHLNVMLTGRVTMIEPDGSHVVRSAPLVYVAQPGRKVGYIWEDVVWLNVYATDETDVETLEAMFLKKSETFEAAAPLLTADRAEDRADFEAALLELGFSAATVEAQSKNPADLVAMPPGAYGFRIGPSRIHGRGVLATRPFAPGEIIGPARVSGLRTPIGRYANHASNPNAEIVPRDPGIFELRAIRHIGGSHGGQDGEEITVNYRQVVAANVAAAQESNT